MNKKMDVFMSVAAFQEADVRDKTAVIIDVLRASSTMITAIEHGASGIIPVDDLDAAGRISQSLDSPQYLLCGERDGKKIEGYHLGNSPLEYTREKVEEKKIILNTTNGTKAVKKATIAEEVIIGGFLNLGTVVEHLQKSERDIVLICAGWRGRLAFEDLLCAGAIIYELCGDTLPEAAADGVRVAFGLYEKFGDDVEAAISASDHARRLKGIIDPEEVVHCCMQSTMDVLPILNEGIITDLNGKET